ncbi:hypothetical protein [Mycobacterium leprae]|uniref:hypothetical protein n=1 Tax=Mycobacterium leprae TaxID=1769 RepID=UPI000A63CB50|nr:hypothetical protein [Mycobacterium leprae]
MPCTVQGGDFVEVQDEVVNMHRIAGWVAVQKSSVSPGPYDAAHDHLVAAGDVDGSSTYQRGEHHDVLPVCLAVRTAVQPPQ